MIESCHTFLTSAAAEYGTPFYIISWPEVLAALGELQSLKTDLPIRHWFSFKTCPVRPVLTSWRDLGLGVEIVSAFELQAALAQQFAPQDILVNGVAKHTWLPQLAIDNLRVHFDSLTECEALAGIARKRCWEVGLRYHPSEERDPDDPDYGGQFGLSREEMSRAVDILHSESVGVRSIHFHLRSNVEAANCFASAIEEMSTVCAGLALTPVAVDCGGGLPVAGEWNRETSRSSDTLRFAELRSVLRGVSTLFPDCREIWLENGRFLTARAGMLVIRVIDIKERREARYLICDGGRTNNALVADWEIHEVEVVPRRDGPCCRTVVCGPTCMAFDWLVRDYLPSDIAPGDLIIWQNAGAYHIPWETRFSHGLAPVLWHDGQSTELVRARECFEDWWSTWI